MAKTFATIILALLLLFPAAAQHIREEVPPARRIGAGKDSLSISFIGDVMMHTRQLDYDCTRFLEHIGGSLKDADIAVANMEFTLAGKPYSGYPAFSAPDEYAESIFNDSGVDVFLCANNHILDKGRTGLERTLEVYDRMGVRYCGAFADSLHQARNSPLMFAAKGILIALVNFTYGTNNPYRGGYPGVSLMRKDEVGKAIKEARRRGADFVIALPHWGEEYRLTHNSTQESWAGWLAEQGVDAIVGCHPHVVQDSCSIAGVPVFYSTGNCVSNMSAVNTRLGLMVTLNFTVDTTSGEKKMLAPDIRFTWCTLPGTLEDSYRTIFVDEWEGRRSNWRRASDYDEMMSTLARVKATTGIK